jgi:hypothetical protein
VFLSHCEWFYWMPIINIFPSNMSCCVYPVIYHVVSQFCYSTRLSKRVVFELRLNGWRSSMLDSGWPTNLLCHPTSNYRTIGNIPKQRKDKNNLKLFSIIQMYSNNLFLKKKINKKWFLFSKKKKFPNPSFLFFKKN